MVVEKLKLSIAAKSAILDRGRKFNYPGVTRILKQETINPNDLTHRAKIQGMLLPEGLDSTVCNFLRTFYACNVGKTLEKLNLLCKDTF